MSISSTMRDSQSIGSSNSFSASKSTSAYPHTIAARVSCVPVCEPRALHSLSLVGIRFCRTNFSSIRTSNTSRLSITAKCSLKQHNALVVECRMIRSSLHSHNSFVGGCMRVTGYYKFVLIHSSLFMQWRCFSPCHAMMANCVSHQTHWWHTALKNTCLGSCALQCELCLVLSGSMEHC